MNKSCKKFAAIIMAMAIFVVPAMSGGSYLSELVKSNAETVNESSDSDGERYEAPLEDKGTIDITKVYRLANVGTISPAETFGFTVTSVDATNGAVEGGNPYTAESMPKVTIVEAMYEENGAVNDVAKKLLYLLYQSI